MEIFLTVFRRFSVLLACLVGCFLLLPSSAHAAFPTVAATNNSAHSSLVSNHTVNLPASISSGDLLIVYFFYDGNIADVSSPPAGWSWASGSGTVENAAAGFAIFKKVATGSEGATVTVTTTGGTQSVHRSYRITGAHGDTSFNSATATNDPPSLTPAWGSAQTLWLASLSLWDDAGSISAAPGNYSDLLVDTGGEPAQYLGTARRQLVAVSEDPGAFTSAGTEGRVVGTLAIRPTLSLSLSRPPNNLGLVGYWNFDEATSTTATDTSGNGWHGTLSGNAVTWVSGKKGSALQLGGSADNVNVGNITSLNNREKITISAWIYDTAGTASKSIFSRWTSLQGSLLFYVSDPGAGGGDDMQFSPDGVESGYTTGNLHQPNRWEHWTVVYDGSLADANKITFYLNGTAQAETLSSTPVGAVTDSSSSVFRIGADSDEAANFTGRIDDVRVYNRALAPSEVATLHGSGAVRISNSSKTLQQGTTLGTGLVGHWTFDGGDTRWTSETVGVTYNSGSGGDSYIGTMTNMVRSSAVAIGKLGQGLNFTTTSNDGVSVGDINETDGASAMSVALWLKPTANPLGEAIVSKCQCSVTFNWHLSTSDSDVLFDPGGDGVNYAITGGSPLTVGQWTHVVVVFRGGVDGIKFYINGSEVSETEVGTIPATTGSNATTVNIGRHSSALGGFVGVEDDVRIYNRALTAAEVKQLYNLGQVRIRQ